MHVTIDPAIKVRLYVEQTEIDDNERRKMITIVQDKVYKYCLNVDYVNDLPLIAFEARGVFRLLSQISR